MTLTSALSRGALDADQRELSEARGLVPLPEIGRRVGAFQTKHPDAKVIKLGIGDVTRPLPPTIVEAFRVGVDEMGNARSFRGYGPEQGYPFLIERILEHDHASRGVRLEADEIFVSDGSKCDSANIQEIFGQGNVVALPTPSIRSTSTANVAERPALPRRARPRGN
jgi:LL-diaminopimelate aminotransferase